MRSFLADVPGRLGLPAISLTAAAGVSLMAAPGADAAPAIAVGQGPPPRATGSPRICQALRRPARMEAGS